MRQTTDIRQIRTSPLSAAGITLLEVVVAVAVFAFGMLALAQLQTNLTRSSADSNARTVAVNVAEEVIERARAWRQKTSDPDNPSSLTDVIFAFDDLVAGTPMTASVGRGALEFDINADITDYAYAPGEAGSFCDLSEAGCEGAVAFKSMQVTVSWDTAEFVDSAGKGVGDLNSGSVQVTDIISSIPSLSTGKVITADEGATQGPPTSFDPGSAPDAIALDLDGSKFKESSTPLPDVVRSGELTETWFDVITYNQGDDGATITRREEFITVSCECTLLSPSGDGDDGLPPTIWTGLEYSNESLVGKWSGESASNQQSLYCNVCCRDHHDGGGSTTADKMYDYTATPVDADHPHYDRDRRGNLVLVDRDGDDYIEACRLIRKDGFFRVAQDFNLKGYYAFPDYYLDGSGANTYADYVVDAITDYHTMSLGSLPSPADLSVDFPADTSLDATTLPTIIDADSQQLRSRGVYTDYVSQQVADIIDCMLDYTPPEDPPSGEDCDAPGVTTWLEVYPFFDTQLSFLAYWTENSGANPVAVTSQPIETGNTQDRGRAYLTTDTGALVTVSSNANVGNIGLTVTDPVYPDQDLDKLSYNLFVEANGSGPASPPSGFIISGDIVSSVGGVQATDAQISGSTGVVCSRTQTGFTCFQDESATAARITVSGYYKNAGTDLWACADSDELTDPAYVYAGPNKSASWALPGTDLSGITINIQNTFCPEL